MFSLHYLLDLACLLLVYDLNGKKAGAVEIRKRLQWSLRFQKLCASDSASMHIYLSIYRYRYLSIYIY